MNTDLTNISQSNIRKKTDFSCRIFPKTGPFLALFSSYLLHTFFVFCVLNPEAVSKPAKKKQGGIETWVKYAM